MAPKKRKPKRRANTDALLKESLVAALRRDASNEQHQTRLLGDILGELSLIRAMLEHEAKNYNLPASKAPLLPAARRRTVPNKRESQGKGRAIK